MITAAGINKPLPVRPTEPVVARAATPPQRHAAGVMRPLPVPTPEPVELVDAIRQAAYERMLKHVVR